MAKTKLFNYKIINQLMCACAWIYLKDVSFETPIKSSNTLNWWKIWRLLKFVKSDLQKKKAFCTWQLVVVRNLELWFLWNKILI